MPTSPGHLPRLAVIGVTGYASIYLVLLRDALRKRMITLNAAVIINAEEVPEIVAELTASGTTIYPDADTFFARECGRIDLCLMPVGIQWHARLTIAALNAGMNVLVEKPLAGSLADIARIRHAETETGRWVAVGFQDFYSPDVRRFKTQLLEGIIGRLESVHMIGLWPRPRFYFARNNWAGRIQADGAAVLDSPLNNAFGHFINLSLYFAGPSLDESAGVRINSAELHRAHRIEMFDTAVVDATTESGTRLWFGVSHASGTNRDPEFYLQGSAGRVEWWHDKHYVVFDRAGERREFPLATSADSRLRMLASVVNRLTNPEATICTTAIAEKHTRFIEAVQDAGSVKEFPGSLVEWIPESRYNSEYPLVRGLAEKMDLALRGVSPFLPSSAAADSARIELQLSRS
jgi:predicted dehydrogenase